MEKKHSEEEKTSLDSPSPKLNKSMIAYHETGDLFADTCEIVESAQSIAYAAVDTILVQRNWLLGKRIAIECLNENGKADYGKKTMKKLSSELKEKYGKGFDFSSLYKYVKFHQEFPQNTKPVEKEMKELTATYQADKLEFIKNPVIAEFLGLSSNTDFTESELEQRIITHIQKFLMELGKGYAFVARQQHIRTEKEDYYIDLVFYNYILKCFVLIDLKTSKITHQDVGQMDMYIRMYDEMKRNEGDNPTLGIILCSDTDEDIAKYSILHGHEQLFASKYKTCLPSEEQLREEIEIQKRFYYLQKEEDKENKDL